MTITHITPREAALERENERYKQVVRIQSATIEAQQESIISLMDEVELKAQPVQEPDLEKLIDAYVDDYEFSDGEVHHYPTEFEQLLIKDSIIGLLGDTDWDAAWGSHIESLVSARLAQPVQPAPLTDLQIEAILEAADEWARYVEVDTAPHNLRKHLEAASKRGAT